jgi:hypothetical protein
MIQLGLGYERKRKMVENFEPKRGVGDSERSTPPDVIVSRATQAPLVVSRALAQEGILFWAKRMHTYADWADAVARCTTVERWLTAQRAFLARTKQDYLEEGAALNVALAQAARPASRTQAG